MGRQFIQSVGLGLGVIFLRILLPYYFPMVVGISPFDIPSGGLAVGKLGSGYNGVLSHAWTVGFRLTYYNALKNRNCNGASDRALVWFDLGLWRGNYRPGQDVYNPMPLPHNLNADMQGYGIGRKRL